MLTAEVFALEKQHFMDEYENAKRRTRALPNNLQWRRVLRQLKPKLLFNFVEKNNILLSLCSDDAAPDFVWLHIVKVISADKTLLNNKNCIKQLAKIITQSSGLKAPARLEHLFNQFSLTQLLQILKATGRLVIPRNLLRNLPNIAEKILKEIPLDELSKYFDTKRRSDRSLLVDLADVFPKGLEILMSRFGPENFAKLVFNANKHGVPYILDMLNFIDDAVLQTLLPLFASPEFANRLLTHKCDNQNIIQIVCLNQFLSVEYKEQLIRLFLTSPNFSMDMLHQQDDNSFGIFSFKVNANSINSSLGFTAMHYIAAYCSLEFAKQFNDVLWLRAFDKINSDNMSPLHCALALNNEELFFYLLELLLVRQQEYNVDQVFHWLSEPTSNRFNIPFQIISFANSTLDNSDGFTASEQVCIHFFTMLDLHGKVLLTRILLMKSEDDSTLLHKLFYCRPQLVMSILPLLISPEDAAMIVSSEGLIPSEVLMRQQPLHVIEHYLFLLAKNPAVSYQVSKLHLKNPSKLELSVEFNRHFRNDDSNIAIIKKIIVDLYSVSICITESKFSELENKLESVGNNTISAVFRGLLTSNYFVDNMVQLDKILDILNCLVQTDAKMYSALYSDYCEYKQAILQKEKCSPLAEKCFLGKRGQISSPQAMKCQRLSGEENEMLTPRQNNNILECPPTVKKSRFRESRLTDYFLTERVADVFSLSCK